MLAHLKITFVRGLEPRTTLREGVVEGLARALGRPIQPAGSWLLRNPVGAWVGRSLHIICKSVWVPGWKRGDRMASGGFALKEVPGLSDRFSTFYSSDCLASSFFLGRPQRGIYWGKCGFSLPGAFLSKQPWYGTIGLKLNSWIKCTHTYEFKDLSTSLVGKFTDGQMVSGREAKLQGLTCRLVVFHELRVQNNQTSLKGVYSIAQAI